jgi:hypothetical protein
MHNKIVSIEQIVFGTIINLNNLSTSDKAKSSILNQLHNF